MCLGGEVDDLVDLVLIPDRRDHFGVADIAFDKDDALVIDDILDIGGVARVRELIKGDKLHIRNAARGDGAHKVRSDKSGGAGDEDSLHRSRNG